MRRKLGNKKGFTLIEVMVAMVLFSVGLLAFAGLEVIVIRNMTFSKDYAKANEYAQQKAEELKGTAWDSVAGGSDTLEGRFSRTWGESTEGYIKHVTVKVEWTDATYGLKTVTFYTDLYKNPEVEEIGEETS